MPSSTEQKYNWTLSTYHFVWNGLQGSARWFTNAFIEDQVKIKFQLLGQVRRNLGVINPDMAEQVSLV